MLERIVGQIVVSLISWLDKRISSEKSAVEASADRDTLRRAGDRIRDWMRKQPNGIRSGKQPDADRTKRSDTGVDPR